MSNTAIQSAYAPPAIFGTAPVSDIPQGLEMETVMGVITEKYGNLTKIFNDAMDSEKARQANLKLVHQAKQEMEPYAGRDVDPSVDGTDKHQALRDAAGRAAADLIAAGYPANDPTVLLLKQMQASPNTTRTAGSTGAIAGGSYARSAAKGSATGGATQPAAAANAPAAETWEVVGSGKTGRLRGRQSGAR